LRSRLTSKVFLFAEGEKGNPSAKRDFLKILGSNFILKDRTLIMKRAYPYELVAKISPPDNWLPLSDEIRNYFKGTVVI